MNCVLIGAGRIARYFHLPALLSMPGVVLSDIVEPDRAAWPSLPSSARLHEGLDTVGPAVQAAVICAPPAQHVALTQAAWKRGLHVYLEKPVAPQLQEAQRLLEVQPQHLRTMVGFTQRFRRSSLSGKKSLARLGRPLAGQGYLGSPGELALGWRAHPETGGGALLEMACHHLDLVQWLLDDCITSVRATLCSDLNPDDRASVWLRLRGGFEFQGLYSLNSAEGDSFQVFTEGGSVRLQRDLPWALSGGLYPPRSKKEGLRAFWEGLAAAFLRLKPPAEGSFRAALQYFFQCLREDRQPEPSLAQGVQIQVQLDALMRSARRGGEQIEL